MEKLIWRTEKRRIGDLVAYEHNPRFMTPEQEAELAASLERFNLAEIPAIDTNNRIVAGHQRIAVLIKMGKVDELIDVRVPNRPLTEDEFREYLIRSNANTGSWDTEILAQEFDLPELQSWGLDIADLLEQENKHKPEELMPVPTPTPNPIVKTGDIFQLGNHRIMCGDSTNVQHMDLLTNGVKSQLVFTSPPYNLGRDMYTNYKDNLESNEYIDFNMRVIETILPHLTGMLFWNISYAMNARHEFISIAYKLATHPKLQFLEMIVWNKKKGLPITSDAMLTRQYEDIFVLATEDAIQDLEVFCIGTNQRKAFFHKKTAKVLSNYIEIGTDKTQLENHKACYPAELVRRGVELCTVVGEMVLDPFGGSGTTLIAAEQVDRHSMLMELLPEYCEAIIRRWHNYNQQQHKQTPFIHLNGDLTLTNIVK